ncbi:hypothetical protein ANN_12074 [Periplaneta americana]|uniref:Uncharacterized protein n=1 Tax=Periplaneta americana TaxID=6978 RepID=A0ABQ8T7J4_PERAM|nr:hypothetical protein ANN_12074 [Periplaneta americana]
MKYRNCSSGVSTLKLWFRYRDHRRANNTNAARLALRVNKWSWFHYNVLHGLQWRYRSGLTWLQIGTDDSRSFRKQMSDDVTNNNNRWRSVRSVCYHNLFRIVFCAGKVILRTGVPGFNKKSVAYGNNPQHKSNAETLSMLTVEVMRDKYRVKMPLNPMNAVGAVALVEDGRSLRYCDSGVAYNSVDGFTYSAKYVFPNSSHSCHYRRYRTYRHVLFRMNAVLASQLLCLLDYTPELRKCRKIEFSRLIS